jgi:hypothetical protein
MDCSDPDGMKSGPISCSFLFKTNLVNLQYTLFFNFLCLMTRIDGREARWKDRADRKTAEERFRQRISKNRDSRAEFKDKEQRFMRMIRAE